MYISSGIVALLCLVSINMYMYMHITQCCVFPIHIFIAYSPPVVPSKRISASEPSVPKRYFRQPFSRPYIERVHFKAVNVTSRKVMTSSLKLQEKHHRATETGAQQLPPPGDPAQRTFNCAPVSLPNSCCRTGC